MQLITGNVTPVYEVGTRAGATPLSVSNHFDALPEAARAYIARLEELVGAPIDIISTGPDREETIVLRHPFGK